MVAVILFSFATKVSGQTIGDYRSATSGNWTTLSTWQYYNGSNWVIPSGTEPQGYPGQYSGAGDVTINEGDAVTLNDATSVNLNSLTINKSGVLNIYGNLIIAGDLIMNFQSQPSELNLFFGSMVLVNGDAQLSNKTVIGINSYFIVRGNFTSGGQTQVTLEDNSEVYIFGTDNNSTLVPCDTYPAGCNSGTSTAFGNNLTTFPPDILSAILDGVDCTTSPPIWISEPYNEGDANEGETIVLGANASSDGYTPINYRWEGPGEYYFVTQDITVSIPHATTALSGAYTCTAINNIGCSITASTILSVESSCNDAILTLTSGLLEQTVCENTPVINIVFSIGGDATGAIVTGLPDGVSGNYNSGVFTISGTPTEEGTFKYTATTTGVSLPCTNGTANGSITVNALPTVDAGTYNDVCIDADDIALNGTPAGGTWSGTGVIGNNFDPSVGTQTLTYTYTDGNGCTNSDQTTITVNKFNMVVSDATLTPSGNHCPDFGGPFNPDNSDYNAGVTEVIFKVTKEESTTGNWTFDFAIDETGDVEVYDLVSIAGNNSAITYNDDDAGDTLDAGDNTEVTFTFQIKNVPGTSLDVEFTVSSGNDGVCDETGSSDDNSITHIINEMPAVGSFSP